MVSDLLSLLTISSEMEATEHKNAVKNDSFEIELPAIKELRLFVQCLNEENACSVAYETAAWQTTVSVNAKESSTFAAANTVEVLKMTMTPEYYNQEGDVEVTLSFFAVGAEEVAEDVELTASDFILKNAELKGEITKVEGNVYRFLVTPVARSSFAVLLNRSFTSVHGIPIRQGLIHGCMYDDEAPYLLNTQYRGHLIEDDEEKVIVVALNEPTVVVSYSGVVEKVQQKEGSINTYEVTVRGNVGERRRV